MVNYTKLLIVLWEQIVIKINEKKKTVQNLSLIIVLIVLELFNRCHLFLFTFNLIQLYILQDQKINKEFYKLTITTRMQEV